MTGRLFRPVSSVILVRYYILSLDTRGSTQFLTSIDILQGFANEDPQTEWLFFSNKERLITKMIIPAFQTKRV